MVLELWTDLARTAERGGYDALFFADGISQYDVYGGSNAAGVRWGLQFPRLDPLLLVSAMAQVTEHLGFAVTSSVSYETPFLFARRMSTLDHLTRGRIGWNIVTSFGQSGSRATGQPDARPHDERYDLADEYMEIVYRLWEESWEDGAAVRDREARVFARIRSVCMRSGTRASSSRCRVLTTQNLLRSVRHCCIRRAHPIVAKSSPHATPNVCF